MDKFQEACRAAGLAVAASTGVRSSIRRELMEESGLEPLDYPEVPGYHSPTGKA